MADPTRPLRPGAAMAVLAALAGCSVVPRSRLDDCHTLSRGLRTENAQLKDVTLKLRAHNQDLAQRALDDARRVDELEQANRRLEQGVLAYQEERERLITAFEQFRGALSASADRRPATGLEPLEAFAAEHPGCTFDPASATVTFPAARLFGAGSPGLTDGGRQLLAEFVDRLVEAGADLGTLGVRVGNSAADRDVHPASLVDPEDPGPDVSLSSRRAGSIRDHLAGHPGLDPSRISLIPAGESGGPDVEIHLEGRASGGSLHGGDARAQP